MPARFSPEYYRLLALVCGYERATWKARLMIHVAVYADENYMDDDGYVFMAGYVASAEEWINIVEPWKAVLNEHPRVPYFSSHGFKSEKWCAQNGIAKRDICLLPKKTLKLARLIADSRVLFPAYSRMWRKHFEEIILHRVLALKKPQYELLRDPYYFCYVRLVSLLLQRLPVINEAIPEDQRLSPLDVFVDENGKLAEKASELFLAMKRASDPVRQSLMGHAAPLDDKVTVPLQYADLYIGQLRELYISGRITEAMKILKHGVFRPPFDTVGLDWNPVRLADFAANLSGLPESHWLK